MIVFKDVLVEFKRDFREIRGGGEPEQGRKTFADAAGDVGAEDLPFDVPVDRVGLFSNYMK